MNKIGGKRSRKRTKKSGEGSPKPLIVRLAKAVLFALLISTALVLILALFMYLGVLSVAMASVINTVIKVIGAVLSSLFISVPCRKPLVGALAGSCFIVVAFFVSSLLEQCFIINLSLLSDIIMGALAGCLVALISGHNKLQKAA